MPRRPLLPGGMFVLLQRLKLPLFVLVVSSMGRLCYCDPCHSEDDGENTVNRTCALMPNSKCFASIQVEYVGNQKHELWKYGCLAPDEPTLMQVSNTTLVVYFHNANCDC